MVVEKCTWKYGCKSPVILMIDDFANKCMIDRKNNSIGIDWGGLCDKKNSFYDLLINQIFYKYPKVKATLFVVVGKRTPITYYGKKYIARGINDNDEFIVFLNKVANDSRIELAYHGLTHGEIVNGMFVQEWENFNTLDEAIEQINVGQHIYQSVTGKRFLGGKYCGYKKNHFSDKSIGEAGFVWWCREFNGLFFRKEKDVVLDIREFEGVIDIPTTIDGNLYSFRNYKIVFHPREFIKACRNLIKYKSTLDKQINYLLNNNYVISIQEHTSPLREDKQIQYPNIVTDLDNLEYIFRYLDDKNVWYATCSEVAEYYHLRKTTYINVEGNIISINTEKNNIGKKIYLQIKNMDEFKIFYDNDQIQEYEKGIYEIVLAKEQFSLYCKLI